MADSPILGQGLTIGQLFGGGRRFGLDYYQREYTWSRDEMRTLLNDLYQRFRQNYNSLHDRGAVDIYEPYFLGPYVYHESNGITYLVDGQQRITTLHLLLLHLHRLLKEQGLEDDVSRIDGLVSTTRHGKRAYAIDVDERKLILEAIFKGQAYTLPDRASISLRNLWERSEDLGEDLPEELRGDALPYFCDWLLDRVCMVGIKAANRDQGWEIFQSMNDRGRRPGPIDLLKGFLLAEAGGEGRSRLDRQWRDMLARLSTIDANAPSSFVKTVLLAQYADLSEGAEDAASIDLAFHEWVRGHADQLGLKRPGDFGDFVGHLEKFAESYVTVENASRQPHPGLESIFFNRVNELDNQDMLIFAALRSEDDSSSLKNKAGLVAAYLDCLHARRFVNNIPAEATDLQPSINALVPRLRKCRDAEAVAALLGAELAIMEDDFSGVDKFSLSAGNRRQVRYLLARLTAFVDVGCGDPDRTADFLDERRTWEIEHIWANKFERYQNEVKTQRDFDATRNLIGALLLLPKSDNASYRDDPYSLKVDRYRGQNWLARTLHPASQDKKPALHRFAKEHQLQELLLRAFPKSFDKAAIRHRSKLYRRLSEIVWDPRRLGLISPAKSVTPKRKNRTRAHYGIGLTELMRVHLISPGIAITGFRRGEAFAATINPDGGITTSSGEIFSSLSAAGASVLGLGACPGWDFWRIKRNGEFVPLRQIRAEALEQGLLDQHTS